MGTASAADHVHVTFELPTRAAAELAATGLATTVYSGPTGEPRASLLESVRGASGIICLLSDRIDAELMDAAGPSLRVVANYAVGYDNVDVAAAKERGIVVANTPGVLDNATADLAFALLLATSRRLVESDRFVRAGNDWKWEPDLFVGLDVSGGATLGIVGLGRIGMAVARRAAAFDMQIVATGSRASSPEAAALGVRAVELPELLTTSDVISLHLPLTPDTHHLIGAAELQAMKTSAVLINTARGPIVDELALIDALRDGVIGAAGLDVYEWEPTVSKGLLSLPNVVTAPHIGSAGRATREKMGSLAVQNVTAVLAGRPAPTAVAS
ncbi:2-hydroxyacid dehydrogenase [Herbiconiux daphne]|uniref:D-glycerate dehydrogenase n=1 Tax=Herbiconiux daphne TaxID=2970914 RepID=A0ABT2H330_9MICO|nr:D-glycerate dehydrogenase [Herbiconiux daphne]MCS5734348.1 D-glycerate dehydrogenase [Herbiconiux daphne]